MGKEHRNRSFRPLLASGLACLVGTAVVGQTAPPYKSAKPLSKFTYTLQYLGEYESNIYHVFDESSRTNGMLNVLDAAVDWKYKANRRVTHRASVYAGAGVYMPTTYNDRNTYDFGIKYEPDFRPSRKVTISPLLDISRRSKNVIDDISPDPTRTLTKSQFDGSLVTRFDVGKGRLDIGGGYTVNNYDESDTVILGNPQPLTSWDYNEWHFIGEFRQPFGTKVNGRVEYSLDKRTYRERYRWAGGQRRFTYCTIGGLLYWKFVPRNEVELAVKYTLRTDSRNDANANFYGYTLWQYGVSVDLAPTAKLSVKAGFEAKTKDYPNYYTSWIGLVNRVSIDYKDLSIEPAYQLSDAVALVGYVRNYDKTSNDWAYDYHDIFAGMGFRLTI